MRLQLTPRLGLLAVLASVACAKDKRPEIPPPDASPTQTMSDFAKSLDTMTRDPNLGPPLSTIPDSVDGITPGAGALLRTYTAPNIGTLITDSVGRTVYMFKSDDDSTSRCRDNCALKWPPVYAPAGPIHAGPGLKQSLIGTVQRADVDRRQVTYGGHPLYYFFGDAIHSFDGANMFLAGNAWYMVTPNGDSLSLPVQAPPKPVAKPGKSGGG